MKLSELLRERGYAYQHSSEKLEEITDGAIRTFYYGVDPTADSMHVGQLQGLLVLRRFVDAGHKLIVLVGDGTGMIGDPGGKSAERNLLSEETVAANAKALRVQFEQLLGNMEFEMVNNAEWLHKLNYMEFLRDVGKHFTVNEMIKRDTVRPRLETPDQSISYTEFSYMLLQAYDFLELNKRYGCDLQVGGSDQWGNMVSGVELIRRKVGNKAYAFSWPLLVDKSGKKFGKSEGNAVWLDAKKTSAFQFFQFWYNVEDEMVEELLLKMTLVDKDDIEILMSEHKKNPGARTAQRILARSVTALVHGEEAEKLAEEASDVLFGVKEMSELSKSSIAVLTAEAPTCEVRIGEALSDVLVRSTLAASKREARQFVEEGAITLNGAKVSDTNRHVMKEDFESASVALLKRGKRNVSVLVQA